MRASVVTVLSLGALLSGCASDYGGKISADANALSPEERRLQQAETRIADLSRRLDSVNLTGMDQENLRLRDDIRTLRGEMERMRYDFDQQNRRAQAQWASVDQRLQRFENPMGVNPSPPGMGGAVVSPSGTLGPPPAPTVPPPPPQPSSAQGQGPLPSLAPLPSPPPSAPPPASGPAPVVISQGSGASPEEEGAYLGAFDKLKNGKYDDAVRGFRAMLEKWPQGRYADNAWYWMGEANYVKRDYKAALTSFQSLLQRFPTSPKAPDAMLKSGLAQIELKQEAEGRATLQRVIQAYPSSNAAKLAQQRLEPPKPGR